MTEKFSLKIAEIFWQAASEQSAAGMLKMDCSKEIRGGLNKMKKCYAEKVKWEGWWDVFAAMMEEEELYAPMRCLDVNVVDEVWFQITRALASY